MSDETQGPLLREVILACNDCTVAIGSDDYSGLTRERAHAVRAGIERLAGYATTFEYVGFVHRGCEVCRSPLAGEKHVIGLFSDSRAAYSQ